MVDSGDSIPDLEELIQQFTADDDDAIVEEIGEEFPSVKDNPPPPVLVAFPLRKSVPFPEIVMPILAEAGVEVEIMEKALKDGRHIGLIFAPGPNGEGDPDAKPGTKARDAWRPTAPSDFAPFGVLAEVHKRIKLPDGNSNYICRGLRRFEVDKWVRMDPIPAAKVSYPDDIYPHESHADATKKLAQLEQDEADALARNVLALAQKVASHNPSLGEGFNLAALNIEPAGHLADFAAAYLFRDSTAKQAVLEELNIKARLRLVDEELTRELVTLELGDRIQNEIRIKIEEQQKEYFLREQIKIIRRELGEEKDPQEQDREFFLGKLDEGEYPDEVVDKVRSEVDRLGMIPTASPEYSVVRNYLEWMVELPWCVSSDDQIDLDKAETILERDHHGLSEAKERILEFLGVRKLRPEHKGAILCFSGPPGVGKTSLAMALAESMGRKLERMSLGGMRDEAEIKGHRRTYVGALPGRILQMIRRAGTNNPVIVLDEVDKLGKDFRGDPSSALLEVLDPEQNHAFLDLFMDIPFDLSRVMFVATANFLQSIPGPLRDRMEIIQLPGYVRNEKVQIARQHLLPRQLIEHGLDAKNLKLSVRTLRAMIDGYTREAGVRGLDKSIASVCRKRTLEIARRKRPKADLKPEVLEKYLGPAKFEDDPVRLRPEIGVALGLAYTSYGGDVHEIECVSFANGKGLVAHTGSLGDVMTESCRIAHSCLRSQVNGLAIEPEAFQKQDLHIHFPAGAVPKDGPSAGITIACAMYSRLTGRRMKARTAMTGEITLTGEVLAVGGIREKVLAAKSRGVKTLLLPSRNRSDVSQMDVEWTRGLTFHYVDHLTDVLELVFPRRGKV